MKSLFQQLEKQRVPDRPPEFHRHVHQRLNDRLTVVFVVEFVVRVLPFAFLLFFETLAGAVMFSITGRYPERDNHAKRHDEER